MRSVLIVLAVLSLPVSGFSQNSAEKLLVGDTRVTVIAGYTGKDKLALPLGIVLHDFDVPAEIITVDHSPAAHILTNSPVAQIKGDAGQEENPAIVAQKVPAAFAKQLLADLKKTPIPVSESPLRANPEPRVGTLIIRGNFLTVKQGNKTARIMIGLGRGASDVKAHVVISLITSSGPILLSEFQVDAAGGKKPGAAETMGVGSVATGAATSAAMDGKSSVESDTTHIANAVAKELKRIMVAQQWISDATAKPATTQQP